MLVRNCEQTSFFYPAKSLDRLGIESKRFSFLGEGQIGKAMVGSKPIPSTCRLSLILKRVIERIIALLHGRIAKIDIVTRL